MFKFDFDIEESDEDLSAFAFHSLNIHDSESLAEHSPKLGLEPFSEISLHSLLDNLPPLISYSPIHIPLSSQLKSTTLLRRDLFDARFQLISQGAGDLETHKSVNDDGADRRALEFLDAPSDIIPGVYEGGLKTWECSLDLVDYLHCSPTRDFWGKRILEVGCGTSIPSMYIFRELLSSLREHQSCQSEIHFQDYNSSVLQFITLPNILLTWYTSIFADNYRSSTKDVEVAPYIDVNNTGELQITPELKAAFLSTLDTLHITLRFFSGSWSSFDPLDITNSLGYNIVFSSETIYRTDSLKSLINLLKSACKPVNRQVEQHNYTCLVAAKVLYFGVGGGISDFLKAVEEEKGRVDTVLDRAVGVGRKVMQVNW